MVTGAARGIGHAYCRRLAADGANVVAVDIDAPAGGVTEPAGRGDRLGLVCDISEPSQVDSVVDTVLGRYGRCDILVNNAGIFPCTDLDHVTIELWRRVQAVNVEAVLLFARAFAPGMRAAGWGRVVNTGSGITMTQNRDLAYLTSKGTVHALTRALANELGESGITVNAIAPGLVATEGFSGRARPNGAPPRRCSSARRPCRPSSAPRSPRTSATRSPSWSRTTPTSSPVRSCTSTAARRAAEPDRARRPAGGLGTSPCPPVPHSPAGQGPHGPATGRTGVGHGSDRSRIFEDVLFPQGRHAARWPARAGPGAPAGSCGPGPPTRWADPRMRPGPTAPHRPPPPPAGPPSSALHRRP
ncbi:hypothetical protein GCM10018793_20580 [Streptomyces sulfonofaciens]|uniref:Uncharacterized protein n=1 Tax=Streptomyces sulfonofaciens TaxID=68272 RepID=A0A919G0X2_9ACTN|nr:hypothetical protein GCM10018793_20580 [Streptomyces sulfonofaciens]